MYPRRWQYILLSPGPRLRVLRVEAPLGISYVHSVTWTAPGGTIECHLREMIHAGTVRKEGRTRVAGNVPSACDVDTVSLARLATSRPEPPLVHDGRIDDATTRPEN